MKCKMKPVTNSSSTSYVMWGVSLDSEEIQKNEKLMLIIKEACESDYMKEEFENPDSNICSIAVDVLESKAQLQMATMPDDDILHIGECPFDMKDEQTLIEFKQDICDKLEKIGIDKKPNELGHIEECYQDG